MSTQQLSIDRPLGAAAVGCLQIRKWFMNEETGVRQLYRGTVIRFYKKDEHYKILYEDSDIEDLEWKDMMKCSPQLIADDSADQPADDTTNPPAKRRKTAKPQDFSAAAAAAGPKQKQQQQPKTQKHPKQETKQPKAAAADAAAAGVKSPQAAGAARPSRKQEQVAAPAGPAGAGGEQRAGTSAKQHGAQQPPAAAVQGAGRATRAAAAAAGAEHSKDKAAPVAAAGADKSAGKAAKQLNTEEAPAAAPAGRNRKNPAATDAAVAKPSKSAAGAEKSKAPKQQGTAKPSVDDALGKGRPKSAAADAPGAKPGKGAAAAGVAGAAAHGAAASAGVPKGAKQGAGKQANNKAAAASAAAKAAVAAAKAKAKARPAAAAGAGASAKPSKASAAKGKTQAAAAAAAAGGVGTSKAQKQRKKQQQGDVQAAADQQPKAQGPQPPWVEPMPKYGPANVCEEYHRAGRDAYLADMKGIACAAQQAHEVVCMDDGAPMWEAAARIQEGETPEIRKQVEDKLFPIAKDAQDAMRLLSKKAARFEKGKEPYRRFALPPHIMELLKDPKDSAKLAAAAAAMEPVTADKPKRRVKKAASAADSSAEAAAGAASAGGADSAADSSAAAEAAAGGDMGSSKKAAKKQGGKKRQADTVAEADQQQKKRSKTQKTGVKSAVATGAAAAAGDDDAAAAAAAAGQEAEEVEWLTERQWETLWVPMEEFADPDGKLALAIQKQKTDFDWEYRTACVTEEERVTQGKLLNPDSKLSRRPDRVTESAMQDRKVNDRGGFGHVPGFKVNSKFELRALCSLAGMHKVPVAGMVFASLPNAVVVNGKVYEGLKAVTSVVSSGTYSANKDAQANEDVTVTLIYTGQGSNDLLGGKAQMDDQVLQGANAYMLVNWALGIPVRYLRRNDDSSSSTNSAIIYDGLYWVVSACRQWVDGQDKKTKQPIKCLAYVFGLKRIPGQPESLSKPIPHWKAAGTAQKGKCTIERRAFGMCRDVSKGVESTALEATADTHAKAAAKVAATNAVDNMLPPGLDPKEDQALLLKAPQGRTWVKGPRPFRYIRQPKYTSNMKLPQPPRLVIAGSRAAADAEEAIRANAAAGGSSGCGVFIPPKYANAPMWNKDHMICTREEVEDADYGPHRLLARLNGGKLPYRMHTGGKGSRNVVVAQSGGGAPRVLIECGPWTGCKLGDKCPQRQALRGLQFQFEVYKTPDCGLGLMSWQNIPASALVCIMVGKIFRAEDVGPGTAHGDSAYVFNLAPRPDTDHLGGDLEEQKEKEQQQQQQHGAQASGQEAQGSAEGAAGAACCSKGQQTENGEQQQQQTNKGAKETTHDHKAKYVLDARDEGNLARFINHSCDPNLYVQPILSGHTDTDHVLIGLFAMRNIPAFTPLSYDYGVQYILEDFGGVCKCGADCCYSKLPQNQQQQQAEASTAPSPSAAAAAAAAGGIKRKGCNGAGCSKQR